MRFAYADPPYPGTAAKFYLDHPDYAGEVNHAALIHRLVEEYPDGWALHTHVPALRELLPVCPTTIRVCAWAKPFAKWKPGVRVVYSWEPVLLYATRPCAPSSTPRGRTQDRPSDCLIAKPTAGRALVGEKPREVCRWVFRLLGAQPGDELDDLFPGTGAVTRYWREFTGEDRWQGLLEFAELIGPDS